MLGLGFAMVYTAEFSCHLFGRTLFHLNFTLGLALDRMLGSTIVEAEFVIPDFVLDCAADYLFDCFKWVADSLLALKEVNNWSFVLDFGAIETLS